MAESDASSGRDQHPEIDWNAAERSPEFRELIKKRRNFVLPATIFFFAWYFGFILLAGYAPSFMGESVYEGLTVGYVLALTQFIMTWVLAGAYVRRSSRVFDPLSHKAAETALEAGRASAKGGRPDPGDTTTGGGEVTAR
jgi:uncharacterized membrane protein (DUF485 family)